MSEASAVVQSGVFVAGRKSGRRFRLVSEPAGGALRGTVVFVHAFAEEMNKARRMAARMARLLAAAGWRVVQRDLAGCGDSSGDFGDATWDDWVTDVEDEVIAAAPERPLWVWGMRAGALLAACASSTSRSLNLLLWQPVLSGNQHLQQFLRLHAGARIVGAAPGEHGASPQQILRDGRAVEVGGYMVHPVLAAGLGAAKFELPEGYRGRILWYEVSAVEPPQLAPPSARLVATLQGRGLDVHAEAVMGPPFWQTQEIEESESLLERTLAGLTAKGSATAVSPALAKSHTAAGPL